MAGKRSLEAELKAEILRCQRDFVYYCRSYLKIRDKNGKLVPLVPTDGQMEWIRLKLQNPRTKVLKARQVMVTTIVAAWRFHKAHLFAGQKTLVVAHLDDVATRIYKEKYREFYANLPDWMKRKHAFADFTIAEDTNRNLVWKHGGGIYVATAGSSKARSGTYQAIHLSEFAFYEDPHEAMAGIGATLAPGGELDIETTANGHNLWYEVWNNEDSGHAPLFLPWTRQKEYRLKKRHKVSDNLAEKFDAYCEQYKLDEQQRNWAASVIEGTLFGDWKKWLQEYPPDPESAFVASGDRYFSVHFPGFSTPEEGHKSYALPRPHHFYIMGVDTSAGSSDGDYSAFVILDVTRAKNDPPRIVTAHTFYGHIKQTEFAKLVHEYAEKYQALAVVESNSYGLPVIDYLREREYPLQYRRERFNKVEDRWVEELGFHTSGSTRAMLLARLQKHLHQSLISPLDQRLKCEVNTFVYNEAGKPEAPKGAHDDMIFAYGLALMGLDQVETLESTMFNKKPNGLGEILLWEQATGLKYDEHKHRFADYEYSTHVQFSGPPVLT